MGLEIDNTISMTSGFDNLTLGKLREFVRNTEDFADETLVKPLIAQSGLKLSAKYGDVTGNY